MSDVTRRHVLGGAAILAGSSLLPHLHAPLASAQTRGPGYDPHQRFLQLEGGGNGIVYGVQADGRLLWYRHLGWRDGTPEWANDGVGREIDGGGWHEYDTVLAADDGLIFAFRADGQLYWYRYKLRNPATGEGVWHPASGSVIGSGFDRFPRVFGGWDGVIYGLDDSGQLWWFRYLGGHGKGEAAWALRSGNRISDEKLTEWKHYIHLWAESNGVIFGARQGGELRWWRYLAGDGSGGSAAWANDGRPIRVGSGWGDGRQKEWLSNGSGTVYVVRVDTGPVPMRDDTLTWYRLNTYKAVDKEGARWSNNGSGVDIASGFSVERVAAVQGYAQQLSVKRGQQAGFAVSTTFPTYLASIVRLAPNSGDPITVSDKRSLRGQRQALPDSYRSEGCGWTPQVRFAIPSGWQSGVYALRLEGLSGRRHYVPFVVRPTTPSLPIAFLLPTNTYNAYNFWGGHNQYSVGQAGRQRTVTFQRPSTTTDVEPVATISHTLYSDLFLTRWMSTEGISFDCYHDGDLHSDSTWLPQYKALVLATHPEYFSDAMRGRLVDYIEQGGRIIYTGGNGIYERVRFTSAGDALVFRTSEGQRDLYRNLDEPEWEILGVWFNPAAYMDFHPYQVVQSHPLLEGTGLSPGDTFGSGAYNGAASGWEVDVMPSDGVEGATLIARGTNPDGGANLVFVDKGNGGWVFSVGSLSFNGALFHDERVERVLQNVFQKALE